MSLRGTKQIPRMTAVHAKRLPRCARNYGYLILTLNGLKASHYKERSVREFCKSAMHATRLPSYAYNDISYCCG